ncbi:MAG: YicC/YloC family endoribonuclease [bacterium]
MSIISMTGFGRGEAQGQGIKVVAELGSVNRKQFDCHVNLPRELAACEGKVQALVHVAIRRGHIKGSVEITRAKGGGSAVQIDMDLARARLDALRLAARTLKLPDDLSASRILDWPGVVRAEALALDPETAWPLVERAVAQALENLTAMRLREGRALARDLAARLARLRKEIAAIRKFAPAVVAGYRKMLADRIAAANHGLTLDDAVLARELALFADRCDISEELTRLESHFAQADQLLAGAASCGRTMDFLCQEFFREINTIGSKANDAEITRRVVGCKAELEAIREQVQNVE